MTIREAFATIGKAGTLATSEGLRVRITIVDAKQAYGNVRLHVQGEEGTNAWIDSARVKVIQ
jgi:hypothetical protein